MKQKYNGSILAYCFLIIISFQYSLVNTELEISGFFSTGIMIFEVSLFFVWTVRRKYKLKIIAGIVGLLLIAAITYFTTSETVFMIMIMAAIISSDMDWKKTFKVMFYTRLFMFVLVMFFSIIGILNINEVHIIKSGTHTEIIGYGLGFIHPNQLAYVIGYLMLLWMAYKAEKIKWKYMIIILAITIASFALTKSRTLLFVMLFMVFLYAIYEYQMTTKVTIKVIKIFGKWFMLICAIIALGLPILMSTVSGKIKIMIYAVNGAFASRFTHSARVLENYSIPIFGGITDFKILQNLYQYSTVDNGYLRLLYNFGIVGFLVFIILYFLTIKKLIENENFSWVILIMCVSLWGISENILRSLAFDFTPIFWGVLLGDTSQISSKRSMGVKIK